MPQRRQVLDEKICQNTYNQQKQNTLPQQRYRPKFKRALLQVIKHIVARIPPRNILAIVQ